MLTQATLDSKTLTASFANMWPLFRVYWLMYFHAILDFKILPTCQANGFKPICTTWCFLKITFDWKPRPNRFGWEFYETFKLVNHHHLKMGSLLFDTYRTPAHHRFNNCFCQWASVPLKNIGWTSETKYEGNSSIKINKPSQQGATFGTTAASGTGPCSEQNPWCSALFSPLKHFLKFYKFHIAV